jgi:uncharacterized protein YbjT (DUF2867 family)
MILVVGASGLLGGRIAQILLREGRAVRVVSRDASRVQALTDAGAEVAVADIRKPETLAGACEGVHQVVTTANSFMGRGADSPAKVDGQGNRNLIDAASRAGVRQLVFTSAHLPDAYRRIDFFGHKFAAEDYLRASGVPFTILRPTAFVDIWAQIIGEPLLNKGKAVIFGSGQRKVNYVAVDDVARVAAWTVGRREALGQTILIAGPDNLTAHEVAEIFERVSGRPGGRSRVPAGALRVLGTVLGPVHPPLARQMRAGYLMDSQDQAVDNPATFDVPDFPIPTTRVEDWVRDRYAAA